MRSLFLPIISAAVALSAPTSHAFQPSGGARRARARSIPSPLSATPATREESATDASPTRPPPPLALERHLASSLAAASLLLGATGSACAVSGGGLDYAGLDISGQDFGNGNYKGKDFTQVIAKATNFAGSNLQGCRFYKAYLVNTNFEGADVRGVSFEGSSMDGANLRNINAAGSYFFQSLVDVETLEGADFTDAQIPPKTLNLICEKEGFAKGTNPTTGVDTRDSLMCL